MAAETRFEKDVFKTNAGDLEITFLGHGSLLFGYQGKHIYLDPFSKVADYTHLPKADLILITHEHRDHLDPEAVKSIRTPDTIVVQTETCALELNGDYALRNGETCTVKGVKIEALPAYNIQNLRENGLPFHPKGAGNGYLLTFGGLRLYAAGDTENTPEMKTLKDIDCAFLPMNLPYTMTPEMVADAALAFVKPRTLYPYHYGETDPHKLVALLKAHPEIEVRIRTLA